MKSFDSGYKKMGGQSRFGVAASVISNIAFALTAAECAHAQSVLNVTASTFQDAVALSTLLTTLNAGFFSQGQAFTNVPTNKADQVGSGLWVRGNAGLFDVKSTGTLTSYPPSGSVPSATRTTYAGVQAGADIGKFNLGSSGVNIVIGVTGGDVELNGSSPLSAGKANFSVPFIGTYFVLSKDGFVSELAYRHDFDTTSFSDSNAGIQVPTLAANADTVSLSASYKYKLPADYFVEPSGTFFISRLTIASFAVTENTSPGTFQANPINSDLGRLGIRLGKGFSIAGIGLEAFFAFSAWHEFAGPNSDSYTFSQPSQPLPQTLTGVSTRVGTFEQYGVGLTASLNKSLLAFVRGDLRSGDNLTGNNITGGFRYTF